MDTPDSQFAHPDWVAQQRVHIAAMKERNSEAMMLAFGVEPHRQDTALRVYQTLQCQHNARLIRLYGPSLIAEPTSESAEPTPLTVEAALDALQPEGEVPPSLERHVAVLRPHAARVSALLMLPQGPAFEDALAQMHATYRLAPSRRELFDALNAILACRGIVLTSVPGRADYNLWRHGLIGSSLPEDILVEDNFEDFEGEDSVDAFTRRLRDNFLPILEQVEAQLAGHPEREEYHWYHDAPVEGQPPSRRAVPEEDFDASLRRIFQEIVPRTGAPVILRSGDTHHG